MHGNPKHKEIGYNNNKTEIWSLQGLYIHSSQIFIFSSIILSAPLLLLLSPPSFGQVASPMGVSMWDAFEWREGKVTCFLGRGRKPLLNSNRNGHNLSRKQCKCKRKHVLRFKGNVDGNQLLTCFSGACSVYPELLRCRKVVSMPNSWWRLKTPTE